MIPEGTRIFVCTEPVDMRRSFDGLALTVRERVGLDPVEGGLFVFVNKRCNHLKLLWFDQNGYCILYKRLHRALFRPPRGDGGVAVQINAAALVELLRGASSELRHRAESQRRQRYCESRRGDSLRVGAFAP